MRIASYNILNGGLGRHDGLAETLLVIDADLVVLQEATDRDIAGYLAQRGGYEMFFAESRQSDYHVALLGRLPIRRAVNLSVRCDALQRSACEAIVDIAGQSLRIIGLHLVSGITAQREQQRMDAVDAILAGVDVDEMPTALLGDFNAHAPWHPLNVDAPTPDRQDQIEAARAGVNAKLLPRLADAGWADVHHQQLGDAVPHTIETYAPCLRVDYVLANAALAERSTRAGVETRGFAPYVSDHFPVWADFTI